MRNRLLAALSPLFLALTPDAGAAQTALQLRWELTPDSQATFTLTNRDTKPLPASGWAIYFSALHSADSGSVGAGFAIQEVLGDLHRIVPGAGFAGLAPGATVKIPYVTQPLRNRSFVPSGPYIVFDSAKDVGVPLSDYVAAAFERSHDVVTPEAQFALDSAISDIPASELPPVFPTPLEVTQGTGALRLTALPQITAGADLVNEATFAAEYLRPYFRAGGKATVPPLRLELGPVGGQSSPEAYELVIDPAAGVRIVGVSSAGVFYGLQSLRDLLPPPAPSPRGELVLPAIRVVYASVQGYPDNVINPALESTYRFIERVVGDLAAMHREAGAPLRHIHMGGDEVPGGVWVGSPAVQAYMQAHGLTSVDDLWFVFYGRIEQILKAQGLVPSGWEEIAVRKTRRDGRRAVIVNPGFAERGWRAYVWNNVPGWGAEDLAYRLANGGYDVVLSPVTNYYFDLAWNPNPDEMGLDWGGFTDVRKPFQFIPFDYYRNAGADSVFVGKDRLTDYGRAHIVGIQGNLWSETLGGDGRLDYMMVPKLFGLAERAWAPQPDWARERDPARSASLYREAWSRFVNAVGQRELPRLDREVPGLGYRIPTPGLKVENGMVRSSVELPGFTLRYTTDGSEPTVRSAVVRGPIPLRGTVRVAAFSTTGRKGHTALLTAR